MDEIIKQRISFLMQTRGTLFTYLMVLVGGNVGLILSIFNEYQKFPSTMVKGIILFAGILCLILIFHLLNNVTNEIRAYLYKNARRQNDKI